MRHQVSGKHLGRTSAHRIALRRNLAASLFEHGTISTTIEKAKFVRPFAERLITLAKDGSLHARRRAISLLQDRDICKVEDGKPVKVSSVIQKLFNEIGPQFADRNGGYTRIVRLPLRRIGDNGKLAILQLVGERVSTPKATLADTTSVTGDISAEEQSEQAPATETIESDKPAPQEIATGEEKSGKDSAEDKAGDQDSLKSK